MQKNILKAILAVMLAGLMAACGDNGPKVRYSPYSVKNIGGPVASGKAVKDYTEINAYHDLSTGKIYYDTIRYAINRNGNVAMSNLLSDNDIVHYSYDESGRVSDISSLKDYKAVYDENNDLVRETYKQNDEDDFYSGVNYTYDDRGNITSVGFDESYMDTLEYTYGPDGKLEKMDTYSEADHYVTYFNENGDAEKVEVYNMDEGPDGVLTETSTFEYEYDSAGNWINQKEYKKVKGFRKPKLVNEKFRTIAYYDDIDSYITPGIASVSSGSGSGSGSFGSYLDDLSYRWRRFGYNNGASDVMLIILLVITVAVAAGGLWWLIDSERFPGFTGRRDSTGMRRMWMYNWQPYASAGLIVGDILGAFITAILAMLIVGAVVWCLFGLVKLILMAVLIVGWILLIIGILGLLAKEGFGCLGLILGGLIVANKDWITETGDKFVAWGNEFMATVNMLGFGYNFMVSFWDVILIVALTPLVIFLAIAALFIILSMLLTGIEWIVTKFYSIRRPCPECGNTGKFEYIINGRPHPVAIRPGVYGVFHQTRYLPYNTNAQYRVPTMLANGRGRLDRRCASCGAMISATGQHALGTDVHIGFVGHVEAGKSYLIYGGLGALMQKFPDRIEQINSGNDNSLDISARSNQIAMNRSFKTDKRSSYRAVEVMIDVPNRPVPYHVHVYDVAGEQFAGSSATSASDTAAMKFYTNVKSVVLVIDPLQLDLTAPGMTPSAEFERWQSEHNRSSRRYNIADIFSSLEGYLNHYGRSGSLKDIDVSIVVVKSDLGFFEALNYPTVPSEGDVESFVNQALGLQSLVNTARKFRSVHFFATSAVAPDKSSLTSFFLTLLQQRGINLNK